MAVRHGRWWSWSMAKGEGEGGEERAKRREVMNKLALLASKIEAFPRFAVRLPLPFAALHRFNAGAATPKKVPQPLHCKATLTSERETEATEATEAFETDALDLEAR